MRLEMEVNLKTKLLLLILELSVVFVNCSYPPTGDEVLPGSVLLPASRRGRYLANIVRRQAIDGTGIKFNKDADRMNAEAKKKVDVLSDELLPYIIAEQERRTTLYKRIMTAIQNGEKGITIAEIRNKPPLIIRKGLMYRCPANRAPKEPDGSGTLMCEDDIEPTQVMYDSCLSAEDKELYVADTKYFFCNRHRIEGPDLPRNGSTVIACSPIERTSHNYTTAKCSLEDTDDVVVHYRYYPDRTYKFVTELDPDHEVCDHWNPCQIGYIYSLPSLEQAMPANEIFRGYSEKPDEYERDEIIPPIPEDALEEFVHPSAQNYTASPRRIKIPPGYKFEKLYAKRTYDGYVWNPAQNRWNVKAQVTNDNVMLTIKLTFPEVFSEYFFSSYYAVFSKQGRRSNTRTIKFLIISLSTAHVSPSSVQIIMGRKQNSTLIPYKCPHCLEQGIMVRSVDGHVHNLDPSKFRLIERTDLQGKTKNYIELYVDELTPQEFGDFFVIVQNADGIEERIKLITVENADKDTDNVIELVRITASLEPGDHFDRTVEYKCTDCELTDIACNGQSSIAAGRVAVVPISKLITFNFPRFEDSNSCTYLAYFKTKGTHRVYSKIVAVIENKSSSVTTSAAVVPPPRIGDQFEHEVPYSCSEDCTIEAVIVNGMPLLSSFRRASPVTGSIGFFVTNPTTLFIRVTEYAGAYEGVYQAVFNVAGENITKSVLEVGHPSPSEATTPVPEKPTEKSTETTHAPDGAAGETTAPTAAPPEGAEGEASSAPPEGEATTPPPEGAEGEPTTASE